MEDAAGLVFGIQGMTDVAMLAEQAEQLRLISGGSRPEQLFQLDRWMNPTVWRAKKSPRRMHL